jgi:hypothetical protein
MFSALFSISCRQMLQKQGRAPSQDHAGSDRLPPLILCFLTEARHGGKSLGMEVVSFTAAVIEGERTPRDG